MSEKIKVEILSDGLTAKERNPFRNFEPESAMDYFVLRNKDVLESLAESQLRTFKIAASCTWSNGRHYPYRAGDVFRTEILENGNIAILKWN